MNSTKTNRNHYIDVLKGIAIISVIFIHTAFHSGNSYVPRWFSNFTVLFEVPIFFFLAGWSYSYSKSNKSYVQTLIITQIKYMIFMFFIYIAINVTNYLKISNNPVNILNLVNWFFHSYSSTSPFTGVSASLWFFRVYFFCSLLGAMIISLVKPQVRKYILAICVILIFLITFFVPKVGNINLGIELGYIVFYLFFYILGYHMKDKNISIRKCIILFIGTIVMLIIMNNFVTVSVMEIEKHKFLPDFIFLLWSLFGVYIVLALKPYFNNCKSNILSIIGQHSMYIFLAQGIGSSVLFLVSKYIVMDWYYKIWIMFGINILTTVCVTLLLKIILDPIGKWIRRILKEKICQ